VLESRTAARLLTLAVIGGVWEWYASSSKSLLIPTFTGTMGATAELLTDETLWTAMFISNQALVIGFTLALVVGIPLGLAMGRFTTMERATDPYVSIFLVMPMAALIPLLIMSTGIGLTSRVILVFLFALVMIVVNSRTGVRQVDPSLIEMAKSFGASEGQLWWRILLPGSLPAVMTGVRIGLGRAITGMILVELLMVSVGLGGLILRYRGLFKPEELYATVIIVVLEALVLITLARWLERVVAPWATQGGLRART
jgi:NitT/TauT family transport system permease protein